MSFMLLPGRRFLVAHTGNPKYIGSLEIYSLDQNEDMASSEKNRDLSAPPPRLLATYFLPERQPEVFASDFELVGNSALSQTSKETSSPMIIALMVRFTTPGASFIGPSTMDEGLFVLHLDILSAAGSTEHNWDSWGAQNSCYIPCSSIQGAACYRERMIVWTRSSPEKTFLLFDFRQRKTRYLTAAWQSPNENQTKQPTLDDASFAPNTTTNKQEISVWPPPSNGYISSDYIPSVIFNQMDARPPFESEKGSLLYMMRRWTIDRSPLSVLDVLFDEHHLVMFWVCQLSLWLASCR